MLSVNTGMSVSSWLLNPFDLLSNSTQSLVGWLIGISNGMLIESTDRDASITWGMPSDKFTFSFLIIMRLCRHLGKEEQKSYATSIPCRDPAGSLDLCASTNSTTTQIYDALQIKRIPRDTPLWYYVLLVLIWVHEKCILQGFPDLASCLNIKVTVGLHSWKPSFSNT